ncbi:homoserine dehydrogenase [Candidatus Kinetoplastibacterium oncopeltii TCC290E]|uniref:Homoserine dehydrogenase n=1 Tax=Candidatus Kinetoplastidibacterium stringomonadis TCC290E TaxID=1208920 RepID=M1LWC1_9PROT|nr:homoserine dehydrogenase [Candidatus Kinetoplastibacterium oncopeltii]AGF48361.1 homoserine dehydrogenase [Candidatus Kinetoplastibacterium oncopeltii TCC290E]
MNSVKVGLLGMGVVGSGTWTVLERNAKEIARRAGSIIEITKIAALNVEHAQSLVNSKVKITKDAYEVIKDPDIDIVVELIGGDKIALDLVMAAIANGKHVVTANKALLAKHGNKVFAKASEHGVMVAFEAAVAGGIPIVKSIREGLTANRIEFVVGIINGTTNFILSEMRSTGLPFNDVLKQAQELGYAESDPTFDIEGVDAAHKLTLLASLAFGVPIQFEKSYIEGISNLSSDDIVHAERLGYRIKLLAITKRKAEGIELRVHPALIPSGCLLSNVEGAMNAVLVKGDAVGPTLYYGQGAGGEPTASAVIADLIDITRLHTADPENRVPHLAFQPESLCNIPILPIEMVSTSYYLRMRVKDRPGVLADISKILSDLNISIGSMIQQCSDTENEADIIFITHDSIEKNINISIKKIESLEFMCSKITRIRIENIS